MFSCVLEKVSDKALLVHVVMICYIPCMLPLSESELIMQFILGLTGFLYPTFSKANREALAPWHVFLGRATFIMGLTTMTVSTVLLAPFLDYTFDTGKIAE